MTSKVPSSPDAEIIAAAFRHFAKNHSWGEDSKTVYVSLVGEDWAAIVNELPSKPRNVDFRGGVDVETVNRELREKNPRQPREFFELKIASSSDTEAVVAVLWSGGHAMALEAVSYEMKKLTGGWVVTRILPGGVS
jgi:hypothetical protein